MSGAGNTALVALVLDVNLILLENFVSRRKVRLSTYQSVCSFFAFVGVLDGAFCGGHTLKSWHVGYVVW
ncbi:hypothetical protein BGX38DRAFT_1209268, partial [Terfezia claveryi]